MLRFVRAWGWAAVCIALVGCKGIDEGLLDGPPDNGGGTPDTGVEDAGTDAGEPSKDAEVDSKPELEIYADDVACSHGATTGDLDPDQLFYLRARGIDRAAAAMYALQHEVLPAQGIPVQGVGRQAHRS